MFIAFTHWIADSLSAILTDSLCIILTDSLSVILTDLFSVILTDSLTHRSTDYTDDFIRSNSFFSHHDM